MQQINLFNIPNYTIDTSTFSNILHDKIVETFENNFCEYVGAKYSCSINSATNAIFLAFLNKNVNINIPSMIPPVVVNALVNGNNTINFTDDTEWIGDSYILHDFGDYKIIDSAQKVQRNQFKLEANDNDLMLFSFYPTKPISSCDGGIIVSNNKSKIDWFKEAVLNGMSYADNNWDRTIKFYGWKMYMNSIQAYIANKNLLILDDKKEKINKVRTIYNKTFKLNNKSDHLYRININNRDYFIKYMKESNVICGIHYKPLHLIPLYNKKIILPYTEKQYKTTVSIPLHENLSKDNIMKIVNKIETYLEMYDDLI